MLADAPEDASPVAWDKPKKAKCFGYYESPTECYKALSNNVLKCCYEVFVRDSKYSEYSKRSPTLAYGDLEYYGDRDTDHVHARANLRRIFHVCATKLGFTPKVYVLCSTRKFLEEEVDEETGEVRWVWKGIWKNSYHFIIVNLYGETCLDVKQLFLPETLRTGVDDDLKGFDLVVYSTCQQLRMPLCSKRGSDVPLRRINADPRDPEDDFTASFSDDDIDAILPALVTVFDKTNSTMHLLKPGTLAPAKEPKPAPHVGNKRKHAQISTDTTSNPAAPLTYSRQLASEIADYLVAMHADHVATHYDTWRNILFAAIDGAGVQAGAPPEFINMIREFTRPRRAADHRAGEYPRIANGTFASARGRDGDGSTIEVDYLHFKQRDFPAGVTHPRALNADPLPDCRTLLAPEDVLMFDLFVKYLRHVNYQATSFKWLVQFASYVVPKLKVQVYETIQGGYKDITKKDFDLAWDDGQPSEIYAYAFKHYLADIVDDLNDYTPPVVTAPGESGGEATADDSSAPHEADATVRHVKSWKPKARGRQSTPLTLEQVLTYIVKTSASVHSFEALETLRKAVRSALKGQKDVTKTTEQLLGLWALLQCKSSKTGTVSCLHVKLKP